MSKRLAAKVETYQKDGETKNKYVQIGVILQGEHGEYALLDPTVDLAGVLLKQNALNNESRGSVMVSVFTDDNRQQQSQRREDFTPPADDYDDDIPF